MMIILKNVNNNALYFALWLFFLGSCSKFVGFSADGR